MSTNTDPLDESRKQGAKNLLKKVFHTKNASNHEGKEIDNSSFASVQPAQPSLSLLESLSPKSPEFDSITELPSPVVLSDTLERKLSGRGGVKKNYGTLSIRPSSSSNTSSRVASEYTPQARAYNATGKVRETLLKDSTNRVVSTPLNPESHGLKRESESETPLAESDKQVLYTGFDVSDVQRTWKRLKVLGRGTFSVVELATTLDSKCPSELKFVAVKIVDLPDDRQTRARVESSLQREIELLKVIRHPSIIELLALNATASRYFMFTAFCEGGDLFELASQHRSELSSGLIRRMFAEVATAVSYLHKHNIVHRDIKLENVLVNFKVEELLGLNIYSKPLITLTDFGLSRRIDPTAPLLTTRCGSEDYVPPELLIGLPYDGRQTDSWALGVLLYAIMEGRLPFDPPPNKSIRARSRVAHRIARIEWSWVKFNNSSRDIDWKSSDWDEAKYIVDNLLIRREERLSSDQVSQTRWVSDILSDEFKVFQNENVP